MKKITKKLPLIKNIYSVVDNFVNATNNLQEQINYLNEQIIDLRQLYSKRVNDGLFIKDRIAVYTAIIGEYDSLHEIECIDEECDYFCFTDDSKLQSKTWQVININKYPELSGGGLSY